MSIFDINDKVQEARPESPRKRRVSKIATNDVFKTKKASLSSNSETPNSFDYRYPQLDVIHQPLPNSPIDYSVSSGTEGIYLGCKSPATDVQNLFFETENLKPEIILPSSNSFSRSYDERDSEMPSRNLGLLNSRSSFPSEPIDGALSFTETITTQVSKDVELESVDTKKFDLKSDYKHEKVNQKYSNDNLNAPFQQEEFQQNDSSEDFERAYKKFLELIPFINTLTASTFPELLVKILNENKYQIPLDDFFNLLYNSENPESVVSIPTDGFKLDQRVTTRSKLEGLRLCQIVLQIFQKPRRLCFPAFGPIIQNVALYSLNPDENLRNFLAIKVSFDTLTIVDGTSLPRSYIPRISIYKVYYIICKRLMQKYQKISTASGTKNNIILSQAQFGKVLKLTFPDLIAKRLGRRGQSKYHYHGVIWNEELIDSDIGQLVELSLQGLEDYFKDSARKKYNEVEPHFNVVNPIVINSGPKLSTGDIPGRKFIKKPLYSFVDSNPFPGNKCFLRSWEITPGKVPQQSQWSREIMKKAVRKLKFYVFDIESLTQNFHTKITSRESMEGFIGSTYQILTTLMEVSAPIDAHLNFYLVICLLIFPTAFPSDDEVPSILKHNFREAWTTFMMRIEAAASGSPPVIRNHLMSFTKIIRKMICCNKMLTSRVPTKLVKEITGVMGTGDEDKIEDTKCTTEREVVMRKIIEKCALKACNALCWEFVDDSLRASLKYQTWFIQKFTNAYVKFCEHLLGSIFKIPESMNSEDLEKPSYALPYKVFTISVQNFHNIFMSNDLISKLPMKLIQFTVINITNEFQTINFRRFGQLEHELSKEIFKTWWVYSTAVQESTTIISEVISLSLMVNN